MSVTTLFSTLHAPDLACQRWLQHPLLKDWLEKVTIRDFYLLRHEGALAEAGLVQLQALFRAETHLPPSADPLCLTLYITPQFNTRSAWSLQVAKFLQDCALTGIEWAERGVHYEITLKHDLLDSELQELIDILGVQSNEQVFRELSTAIHAFADQVIPANMLNAISEVAAPESGLTPTTLLSAQWQVAAEVERRVSLLDLVGKSEKNAESKHNLICHHDAAITPLGEHRRLLPKQMLSGYEEVSEPIAAVTQSYSTIVDHQSTGFSAINIGYGVKPVACLTGYYLADDFQANDNQHVFLSLPSKRARYLSELGVANLGGFVRTGLPVPTSLQVQQYGLMRQVGDFSCDLAEADICYVLLEAPVLKRSSHFLIARCNLLDEKNPILRVQYTHTEQFLLVVSKARFEIFVYYAQREGCRYRVLANSQEALRLLKPLNEVGPVPCFQVAAYKKAELSVSEAFEFMLSAGFLGQVLQHPAVADKRYLIYHFDRSIGGLVARDQLVGHWQVPVSDVAVTLLNHFEDQGLAMAAGERSLLIARHPLLSMQLAFAEALTNILAADIEAWSDLQASIYWQMSSRPATDVVYQTLQAFLDWLKATFGISVLTVNPMAVMETSVLDTGQQDLLAFSVHLQGKVGNVRKTLTPRLKLYMGETELIYLDLATAKGLAGSVAEALAKHKVSEVTTLSLAAVQALLPTLAALKHLGKLLAYHDVSDGGVFVTACEMAFATHCGLDIYLDRLSDNLSTALFHEGPGIVLQVRSSDFDEVMLMFSGRKIPAYHLGQPNKQDVVRFYHDDALIYEGPRVKLERLWTQGSFHLAEQEGNPILAQQEFEHFLDETHPGLTARVSFDVHEDICAPFINVAKPKAALVRSSCSTGQAEMAAALSFAGFDCVDVHMTDLRAGRVDLDSYQLLTFGSGYAYGDVLGAGWAWAQSVLQNSALADTFAGFFSRQETLTLGVGNGAQLLTYLKSLIPGAAHWPSFQQNISQRLESRLTMVQIPENCSWLLQNMAGSKIPVVIATQSGQTKFESAEHLAEAYAKQSVVCQFIDGGGAVATQYPLNPTGAIEGIAGVTNEDGRVTAVMIQPERSFRSVQMSWHPSEWGEYSPWMRVFRNARVALA